MDESNTMRILLIEDDDKLASFIVRGLQEDGFTVDWIDDGEKGLDMSLAEDYDLLLVDIMLPSRDGLSLIKELRKIKSKVPILILSAKRSVEEKVEGLHMGSDDYLTKPFAFVELLARIHALIRRSTNTNNSRSLTVGDLALDQLRREVTRGTRKITLTAKEFSILEYLMMHQGKVVSRTMLMDHVWGFQFDPSTNIVDVQICHLREKISKNKDKQMIHTIRGVGYVLKTCE